MAYSYPYASKYSTKNIVARAYREYTDAVSEAYSRLMTMIELAISETESNTNSEALADSIINRYADFGYTRNTLTPLNQGVTTLFELLVITINNTKLDLIAIDDPTAELRDYDAKFTFEDLDGRNCEYTINTLLEEINSTFHAIAVEQAVASAYELGSSVADKIVMARDAIMTKFANGYNDVSNTLNRAIDAIKNNVDISTYLVTFMNSSGINKGASEGQTFNDSDMASYTGATPAAGYVFFNAHDLDHLAAQVLSTACMAVSHAMEGIKQFAANALLRGSIEAYKLTTNPIDIDIIDDKDGNSTIDGLHYGEEVSITVGSELYYELIQGAFHIDLLPCEIIVQATDDSKEYKPFTDITTAFIKVAEYQSVTLDVTSGLLEGLNTAYSAAYSDLLTAAQTITGISTADTILETLNDYYYAHWTFKANILIRIKPVNPDVFDDIQIDYRDDGYTPRNLVKFFDRLVYFPDLILKDVGTSEYYGLDTEGNFLRALTCGAICTKLMLQCLYWESTGVDISTSTAYGVSLPNGDSIQTIIENVKYSDVTNSDFFDVITTLVVPMASGYTDPDVDLGFNGTWVTGIINNVLNYKKLNPFTYSFWPYSRNMVSWFNPSFRIKTDAENINKFQTFVDSAVIVIAVTTLAIVGFVQLKQYATRAVVEAMGAEWNITDRASQGLLTNNDIKVWKKAVRKANRLSFLTGNLTSSASMFNVGFGDVSTLNDAEERLQQIISLITG